MDELSDTDFANYIRDLRLQIAELEAYIESRSSTRQRTLKLIRGTILTGGGFLTVTIDLLGIVLVVLGLWEWIDAVADDAKAMNNRIVVRRRIVELSNQLVAAETEFRRRPRTRAV